MRNRNPKFNDMTGQTFGKWFVISESPKRQTTSAVWNCRCECGTERVLNGQNLRNGHSTSCGCALPDLIRKAKTIHGCKSKELTTPEYRAWQSMKTRCENPKNRAYHHYGGRGITVCDRWKTAANFLADMGKAPTRKHSLERNDVNGNYEPSNCRWATRKEQSRNTRRNRFLEFSGMKKCVAEWAETMGVKPRLLSVRLSRGWSVEKTLVTPAAPVAGGNHP